MIGKYVLWTAKQNLRKFAKQDFQIKCLGQKTGMDFAEVGWVPPAICAKLLGITSAESYEVAQNFQW